MSKGSTAKKIKDLKQYGSEVSLVHLSKQIKKGRVGTNYVIIARKRPKSGLKNTTVWLSTKDGEMHYIEPIQEFQSKDLEDALAKLGYTLI